MILLPSDWKAMISARRASYRVVGFKTKKSSSTDPISYYSIWWREFLIRIPLSQCPRTWASVSVSGQPYLHRVPSRDRPGIERTAFTLEFILIHRIQSDVVNLFMFNTQPLAMGTSLKIVYSAFTLLQCIATSMKKKILTSISDPKFRYII